MFCLRFSGFCHSFHSLRNQLLINTPKISLNYEMVRNSSSFYTRVKADQLWRGAMGVSKRSAKRGRKGGGGKIMKHDLSRGQYIGVGRQKMVWPGLNAPVITGRQTLSIRDLGPDEHFDTRINTARTRMRKFSASRINPLDRGWSGTKMGGRWVGPPDPVNGEEFIGFDTQVLVLKPVFHMTALFGKYKQYSCLTVTGNMNGLAGYSEAKHVESRASITRSKNKAAQRLQYINLFEGTLYHNFYSKFFATELFVRKMPKGYGVRAHRCVTAICEALGLTDIHCKVEGSDKNYLHITRAFFNGLNEQKTYQQMADEKRLNVVEIVGKYDYPVVLARPTDGCRTEDEISVDEILDYDMYVYNGRVIKPPKEKPMFYTKIHGWETYTKKREYSKHRDQSRIDLISKYGSLESYITQKDRQRLVNKRQQMAQQLTDEVLEDREEQKEEID